MSGSIGQINGLVRGLENQIGNSRAATQPEDKAGFTELLNNLITSVNDLQLDAGKAQELMAAGEAADLHQVMIALEEAGVAMDLLLEIRNKLVDAYQSLMRMPM
ncbi:MAG: flagellar hook-basal body complex protein FliE [Candidatus Zixiibacteriota bacterium]|nr:MAG: flagellar hook-basal body complex protein FliE [candidate division Zixibacteria bacterium]